MYANILLSTVIRCSEQRFKAADGDHDGTLTAVEFLKSKSGCSMLIDVGRRELGGT
jgi:hypothetical protein